MVPYWEINVRFCRWHVGYLAVGIAKSSLVSGNPCCLANGISSHASNLLVLEWQIVSPWQQVVKPFFWQLVWCLFHSNIKFYVMEECFAVKLSFIQFYILPMLISDSIPHLDVSRAPNEKEASATYCSAWPVNLQHTHLRSYKLALSLPSLPFMGNSILKAFKWSEGCWASLPGQEAGMVD